MKNEIICKKDLEFEDACKQDISVRKNDSCFIYAVYRETNNSSELGYLIELSDKRMTYLNTEKYNEYFYGEDETLNVKRTRIIDRIIKENY